MVKKLNFSKYKKRYCFDLDGVICRTKNNYYSKSKPNKLAIKTINKLYHEGNDVLVLLSDGRLFIDRVENFVVL